VTSTAHGVSFSFSLLEVVVVCAATAPSQFPSVRIRSNIYRNGLEIPFSSGSRRLPRRVAELAVRSQSECGRCPTSSNSDRMAGISSGVLLGVSGGRISVRLDMIWSSSVVVNGDAVVALEFISSASWFICSSAEDEVSSSLLPFLVLRDMMNG